MHHPHKTFIADSLARGHLPEWNPYGGLGFPFIAGAVDAVQHPFNLLLVLLPFEIGFKLWVLLSYLVGATGGFVWARALGRSFGPAVAGGLAFALSGYLVSSSDNMQYLTALASVPWILASAHHFAARGGPGPAALLGAASAFAAVAGDPQSWGFAVAAIPAYAILLVETPASSWRTRFARGLAATGIAIAFAAPFVLPIVLWLPESTRGEAFDWIEYVRFNLLPMRLFELVIPHLLRSPRLSLWSDLYEAYSGNPYTPGPWVLSEYVGATTVALAFLAAAGTRQARLLVAGAAVALWMSLGPYAGFGQLARKVPILGGFRYWEKTAFWAALFLAMAAAAGLERIWEPRHARRSAVVLAAGCALYLAGAGATALAPAAVARLFAPGGNVEQAAVLVGNLREGLLHAGLLTGVLAALGALIGRGRLPRAAPLLSAAVLVADLAAANSRAYVLARESLVAPRSRFSEYLSASTGLERVVTPFPLLTEREASSAFYEEAWARGPRGLQSGWNVAVHIGNFEPYTGMIPARQMRYRRRAGLGKQLPGVGMWSVAHVVVPGDPARAARMNLPPPYRVEAADPGAGTFLVAVPHRPRAYIAADLREVDRRHAMEFALDDSSARSDVTVIEGPIPIGYAQPRGEAYLTRDEPERVEVAARSDRPALLVLNDIYCAGWTATVDGSPVAILPANYLARGVWIAAGTHTVAFTYSTPGLRAGWITLALSLLAIATWGAVRGRHEGASGTISPTPR